MVRFYNYYKIFYYFDFLFLYYFEIFFIICNLLLKLLPICKVKKLF